MYCKSSAQDVQQLKRRRFNDDVTLEELSRERHGLGGLVLGLYWAYREPTLKVAAMDANGSSSEVELVPG